jgi:c-di-GMP-related signal transduction protein
MISTGTSGLPSSNEVARFKLLRLIETDEPDVAQLAKAIQTDASISFRLLAYLNSAAFGLPRKIQSIPHAISLLDILLGIPMQEVVAHLPLDPKLKAALCREPNNEYLLLLQLARYFEEAKWPEADKMMQQLNLDSRKVKTAFQTSLNWAGELVSLPAAESEMH